MAKTESKMAGREKETFQRETLALENVKLGKDCENQRLKLEITFKLHVDMTCLSIIDQPTTLTVFKDIENL